MRRRGAISIKDPKIWVLSLIVFDSQYETVKSMILSRLQCIFV